MKKGNLLMNSTPSNSANDDGMPFFGLAPFLRMSIAGADLLPYGQQMLALAEERPGDANLWMNLSLAMQCLSQRETGLAIQAQALSLKRIYHLAASEQPARLRVLMLMVAGDLAANTPLDCLLETGDIDLDFYFVSPGDPLALPLPEHDVLLVAMGESAENRPLLDELTKRLADWPKPVINAPQHIRSTDRSVASQLLQQAPGLLIPPTLPAARSALQAVASGTAGLAERFDGCDFPVILRPVDSQGGRDLDRIESPHQLAAYLSRVDGPDFFVSRFVDYSGSDGLFRKYRIALIDGEPFACHMGVSKHWMVHYVNAGMYEEAHKRAEEADFMACFDDFAKRHQAALDAIASRTGLDYLCIDCAQTSDGQLLVFEVDHCMVVHAMDSEDLFPYKQTHMQKVKAAFRDYLLRLDRGQLRGPR
jgi:glutathione synthase/RimK-type ligase-like ATP-grasp enzyme